MAGPEFEDLARKMGMRPHVVKDMSAQLTDQLTTIVRDTHRMHRAGGLSPRESVGSILAAMQKLNVMIAGMVFLQSEEQRHDFLEIAMSKLFANAVAEARKQTAIFKESADG